ncbi:MAG: Lrp/AsnC family transcriptional regulator [Alphaproteobacteria bacterium]|nr:Lrp/AsnC family transcriptional regulator [Alphaproteobacteria bacterium]
MSAARLDDPINRALLDRYQRDFPLTAAPYATIGQDLDLAESEVIARLDALKRSGMISRIGAVVAPHRAGWSTLAAVAAPEDRLEEVAELVSALPEVNHNYEREHDFNLWFVVTGKDKDHVARVLGEIGEKTGLDVLDLPLEQAFHIDLGFPIRWS